MTSTSPPHPPAAAGSSSNDRARLWGGAGGGRFLEQLADVGRRRLEVLAANLPGRSSLVRVHLTRVVRLAKPARMAMSTTARGNVRRRAGELPDVRLHLTSAGGRTRPGRRRPAPARLPDRGREACCHPCRCRVCQGARARARTRRAPVSSSRPPATLSLSGNPDHGTTRATHSTASAPGGARGSRGARRRRRRRDRPATGATAGPDAARCPTSTRHHSLCHPPCQPALDARRRR